MGYSDIIQMAQSASLIARVTACAASEGISDPGAWAQNRAWKIASTPGWAAKWAYAVDTATVNVNPDTGARIDVINDNDILAAVQAIKAAGG